MFDIDIENGIYTLKRIYFLQCANIQGYTENALIDYISKMCNISKSKQSIGYIQQQYNILEKLIA